MAKGVFNLKGLIGVVGSGGADERLCETAKRVGSLIASSGYGVVCGGLGGVMEAASMGAFESGGVSVGLLPGLQAGEANEYVKVAIPTGMGEMRNALIVRAAMGLVAIGGGAGTLSEIAFAVKTGKPVVSIEAARIETRELLDDIIVVGGPEEAVDRLLKVIEGKTQDGCV